MITTIFLVLSCMLNIRLAYCLGKHYKWTTNKSCQGGCKHLYKKVEEEHKDISLNDEKNILDKDK